MKKRFTCLLAGACAVLAMTTCLPNALAISDGTAPGSNDLNQKSWVADGWKATITRADGTVEQVLSPSEQPAAPAAPKTATNPRELAKAVPDRQWLREKQGTSVAYYGPEDAGHPKYDQPSTFRPTWLPEGWGLVDIDQWDLTDQICHWNFRKEASRLKMTCYRRSTGYIGMALVDQNASYESYKGSPAVELQQVQVQKRSADFYQAGSTAYLFWENDVGDLFILAGDLDRAVMVQVADSVKEVKDQTLPEYQLGWVPKESGEMRQSVTMPGYVQQINSDGNELRFVYSNQALAAPKRTPETVMVRGMQGQLWLADKDAKGLTVTSSITSKTFELPTVETRSTLIWTDSETGICFCIQGNKLTKETMLHMAESVALK